MQIQKPMPVSEQTLTEVAQQVLEVMAFAFVAPGDCHCDPATVCMHATVRFSGPFSGDVRLSLPQAVVPALVSNMLGEDEGCIPTEQQQYDAIGELASVMCGNLVQILAGPEPIFTLRSPAVVVGTAASVGQAVASVTSATVRLDESWAELTLSVEA